MGVFIYRADVYCESCAKDIKKRLVGSPTERDEQTGRFVSLDEIDGHDSDDFPCGPYPDGGGESDCPQHCGGCGVFLENPLTSDGVEYVREKIRDGAGDAEVLAKWSKYYGIESWEIQDWAGNRPFPAERFDTFDDARTFIDERFPNETEAGEFYAVNTLTGEG